MKRTLLFALLLVVSIPGLAVATTSGDHELGNSGWILGPGRADVLVIETTDTRIPEALNSLGVAYDLFSGSDFSNLNLCDYADVFLCMDGGLVEDPSVANLESYLTAGGGHGHVFGGTCWQGWAIAMDSRIIGNNVNDYCWVVSSTTHSTVTDAGHYLATGLPGAYNFSNSSAAYYAMRVTDGAASTAAVNGDGYSHLLSKAMGSGNFDMCINSSYDGYWAGADFDWMVQVVFNMLNLSPTATGDSNWSLVKTLY